MQNDHVFTLAWALRKAEQEPVSQRVRIYRGLAEVCGDQSERKRILADAAELEAAHQKFLEFALEFETKHGGGK